MKNYKNASGTSGISAYEIGPDWIKVRFIGDAVYTYSCSRAGKLHVERMKNLAYQGKGLATYISRYVKDLYD